MRIEGKTNLERELRAHKLLLAHYEAEQDGLFEFAGDPTGRLEILKVEIEAEENMIDAIHFELRKISMAEA